MLYMTSQNNDSIKRELGVPGPFVPNGVIQTEPPNGLLKTEPASPSVAAAASQQIPTIMNGNVPFAQAPPSAVPLANGLTTTTATPIVPSTTTTGTPAASTSAATMQTIVPQNQPPQMLANPVQQQQHVPNLLNPKLLGKPPMIKSISNAPVGSTPGSMRSGNGGGGQLLQFPWKLHEMLHLAEKNGKQNIISWLPGGNGFKVYNKEKFCAEIMPGYFASQKYKTFQRSLNLWGFESVAKGPDRGACYHQYFVKGHPELCHSMTRVKIKGQSNPRTPAAAAAAAAAAAKRAAMTAAMTAAMSANQQQVVQQSQQGMMAQQQQVQQQQAQQQPLNIFAMNHFNPMGMGMPMAAAAAGGNQVAQNPAAANVMANPYAMAMNNFATMNALQQINPALATAALQNPAMNAMIAAQVMAAANPALAAQQAQARAMAAAQQQQQLAPATQQRQGLAHVPRSAMATPATAPGPGFAPVVAAPMGGFPQQQMQPQFQQQQQQQMQQQQQPQFQQLQLAQQMQQQQQQPQAQMGMAPTGPPMAVAPVNTNAMAPVPMPASNRPAPMASPSLVNNNNNVNANANYAEFLSRKAGMDRQPQQHAPQQAPQQGMLNALGNNPLAGAPSMTAGVVPTSTKDPSMAPPAAPVNVSGPDVSNYGGTDVVDDLVAV